MSQWSYDTGADRGPSVLQVQYPTPKRKIERNEYYNIVYAEDGKTYTYARHTLMKKFHATKERLDEWCHDARLSPFLSIHRLTKDERAAYRLSLKKVE